jgi:hypothetical protein
MVLTKKSSAICSFCRIHICDHISNRQLPLTITKKTDCYGEGNVALKWHVGSCKLVVPLYFCPWCGNELGQAFFCSLKNKISLSTEEDLSVFESHFNFETDIPRELDHFYDSQNRWKEERINERLEHDSKETCYSLKDDVEQDAPVVYHANIRAFGIIGRKKFSRMETIESLEKIKKKASFVAINYCYYCGAKLPDRLDETLTKILQNEYGLESWKDYKKAPHEFHTDEWWKKRGL